MIFIRTTAYNAEKTLKRAVDSVLNQTYTDFVYFLCDNGATDSTGDMIREYASKDNRIIPFFNKENRNWEGNERYLNCQKEMAETDFLCALDADDEYELTFFEDALAFIAENNLDIAACGSYFIDATTNKKLYKRVNDKDLIIASNEDFSKYFKDYHHLMRPFWGKMYSAKAANAEKTDVWPTAYGQDTMAVFRSLRAANRVGIMSKILHKYYVSPKSVSYEWDSGRIDSDVILYNDAIDFLLSKAGYISQENQWFLYAVYYNAVNDTIDVLINSNVNIEEQLKALRKIFSNKITIDMLEYRVIPVNERHAIVKNVFYRFNNSIAAQYEDGIWLGLQLSAVLGNQNLYIEYIKKNIDWLINNGRIEEAEYNLEEWEQLLPNDKDLIKLRNKLIDNNY